MVDQRIVNIVRQYVMILPQEFGVKKVFLFGSFAKGREKNESDIDVALILDDMPDFFSTQKQLLKLRRSIDLRIEPHPILERDFNSTNPLAYEIAQTGVEIFAE